MAWSVDYSKTSQAQLSKLDAQTARRIADYMDDRVATRDDPRSLGKALVGPLAGFWRYRVGDYRIICDLQDGELRVLVIEIGRRNTIYR